MNQFVLTENINVKTKDEEIVQYDEVSNIFEAYYKRIYNYVFYRVNNHHIAEDLVGTIFEKVMYGLHTYSGKKSPFEVWLFAIAKNVVNDYFRKLKNHKIFSIDGFKELISKRKTPEEIILAKETNDKLLKALDTLSHRERNIIALKFGGNLKNTEIARLLDITESNVGVILYRSMKKLKSSMEEESL